MRNTTEKFYRFLEKYLQQFETENMSEEEVNQLMHQAMELYNQKQTSFLADDYDRANDLYEKAFEAPSKREARKYAKEALALYPKHYDAKALLIEMEKNPDKRLKEFETLIKEIEEDLKEQNIFTDENIGEFWLILETRPYIRARMSYVVNLDQVGRYEEALFECKEILRLCRNDNLGARFHALKMCVFLNDYQEGLNLFKQFDDHSLGMLVPIFILELNHQCYLDAENTFQEIKANNPHFVDVFIGVEEPSEEDLMNVSDGIYQIGEISEVIMVLIDYGDYIMYEQPEIYNWIIARI